MDHSPLASVGKRTQVDDDLSKAMQNSLNTPFFQHCKAVTLIVRHTKDGFLHNSISTYRKLLRLTMSSVAKSIVQPHRKQQHQLKTEDLGDLSGVCKTRMLRERRER